MENKDHNLQSVPCVSHSPPVPPGYPLSGRSMRYLAFTWPADAATQPRLLFKGFAKDATALKAFLANCKPPGRLFLLQSIKGSAGIGSSAWSTCEVHISCTPPWHFVPTAKMYGVEHLIALSHLALLGACSRPHLLLLEDREAHELPEARPRPHRVVAAQHEDRP